MILNQFNKLILRYTIVTIIVFTLFYLKTPHNSITIGDEQRYIDYANGLWEGKYSPSFPNVYIWNGPGYPIFLMPFVKIGMNVIGLRILNCLMYLIAIIIFDRLISRKFTVKLANFVILFLAAYFPIYLEITQAITESITFLLIVLFLNEYYKEQKNYFVIGLIFGFLVLTKAILGFILLLLLIIHLLMFISNRSVENKFNFKVFIVAFLLNVPYLTYTYSLTGKLFYWANSGGVSLYWMTSPHEGEFGDWPSIYFADKLLYDTKKLDSLHLAEIKHVCSFPMSLRDDEYRKISVNNIKNHPVKYIRNYISNFQRFFFNMPNSYSKHREIMMWYFPFTIFMFLGFILVLWNFMKVNFKLNRTRFALSLILVSYVFLSCLVFAYPRFLNPIVPLIILLAFEVIREHLLSFNELFIHPNDKG